MGEEGVAHHHVHRLGNAGLRRQQVKGRACNIGGNVPSGCLVVVVRLAPPEGREAHIHGDLIVTRTHAPLVEIEQVDIAAGPQYP